MGRNYTIYVKYDEFANEPNKSGLFNKLYEEHLNKISHKVAQLRQIGIDSTVEHTSTTRSIRSTVKPNPEDLDRFKQRISELGFTPCPHGSDPRLCKFAKYDKTRKEKWCK